MKWSFTNRSEKRKENDFEKEKRKTNQFLDRYPLEETSLLHSCEFDHPILLCALILKIVKYYFHFKLFIRFFANIL